MSIKVIVASDNRVKIEAVRATCEKLGIDAVIASRPIPVYFPCGVTPYDYLNILDAARFRAHEAAKRVEASGEDMAFGIQQGILRKGMDWYVTESVQAISGFGKYLGGSWTRQALVPGGIVCELLHRDIHKTTLGAVVHELFGGHPSDPYPHLTGGKFTRHQLLCEALERVFDNLSQKTPPVQRRTSLWHRLLQTGIKPLFK